MASQETDRGYEARSPWRMPLAAWRDVLVRCWRESTSDNLGLISAGVAFYGFLAIVPLLAATLLAYGIFVDPETVLKHIELLTHAVPETVAASLGEQLLRLSLASDETKGWGVMVALTVAIFGARNGVGAIITALNIAYEEEEKRGFFRLNAVALALTGAAIVGAIFAALSLAGLAALTGSDNGTAAAAARLLTLSIASMAAAAAAATLYRFGPSRRAARWIWLSPGSLFSGAAWLALSLGFSAYARYIGKFDATYGSLGAVAALLTWLYLGSYALLLGAELNAELEHQTRADSTRGPAKEMGRRGAWVADHVAGRAAEDKGKTSA